jgi:hypothetical protein
MDFVRNFMEHEILCLNTTVIPFDSMFFFMEDLANLFEN